MICECYAFIEKDKLKKKIMNILKIVRKPYLSIIMATLVLFVSCNKDVDVYSTKIESTVKKHIQLTHELSILYKKQDTNVISLNQGVKFYKNKKEFRNFLTKFNYKSIDQIILLTEKISNNLNNYLLSENVDSNTNENYITDLISKEIIKQQKNNNKNFSFKVSNCEGALNKAGKNCDDNYAIGIAAVIVSAFFTFGWGTVIGYAAVNGLMIKCHNDAASAYSDCINYN